MRSYALWKSLDAQEQSDAPRELVAHGCRFPLTVGPREKQSGLRPPVAGLPPSA